MRVGVLYSGGKDSNFVVYNALRDYEVILITIIDNNYESMLFHHPNIRYTKLQADAMRIPIIQHEINSRSIDEEMLSLKHMLREVKDNYCIKKILSGGIKSRFQNSKFKSIASSLDLEYEAPLWYVDEYKYMHDLLDLDFKIMIISVSAYGLDKQWLGKILDYNSLDILAKLSNRFGFNLAFEGGEAESIVIDAPHFKDRLIVKDSSIHWDGVRGMLIIKSMDRVKKIF
jgi:ABC transporter with metal-binding/Fe-S-binding domain ATP-binding protein